MRNEYFNTILSIQALESNLYINYPSIFLFKIRTYIRTIDKLFNNLNNNFVRINE